jgi:glycosyltransferase involved in cell wall biosynthesis
MRRRGVRAPRAWLRRTFGVWPLFEARHKALRWPNALLAARVERSEVRRLSETVVIPPALVATIVPTCRRPESLVRAVHSALAQTLEDHVVVVVDDGAGLPELPDDSRLVAVSLSRNIARAGVVRNVGIALCRSTYLAFLDDDNEWRPHHLAVALEALGRGADLVYTAMERVHPDGTRLDVRSRPFDRRALFEESFVDTNCIVVRRGRGVRFSRLPRSGASVPAEDWEFVWRLSRRKRISHVPETTVTYLVNPRSYFTQWQTDEPDPPPRR